MSRSGRYGGESKVYVGNLGTGAGKAELERAFGYYGPLRTVWIARNPPGFAFVEFEDSRDAEDAVRGLDGKVICGSRVRVEPSNGMPRRSRYERPPPRRPFDPDDKCYECGQKGHYAYDCHRYGRRGHRSRSRSRSRGRRYSRSRSRSQSRGRRSRSSPRRSRSSTPRRSRSGSPRRSRSGSPRRSRSGSPRRSRSGSPRRFRSGSPGRSRSRSVSKRHSRSGSMGRSRSGSRARSRSASRTPADN
ncbi:serine/arginine-rich splicing factor 7-like isoform X2 [Cyprinodon tularosa]|uniref:serine/arginine-rich splicing factor 7-like isoform X1 n=1 Tax=Cyprinodon tularosa TaxID=77115 RepID=UPI0018E1E9BA|nr:serine/arginine-rich splicing factor 7-like isoform X1 [Cyprinodon tularosa]XP_038144152.1 serine/arginine-rich splicing factor 7-like isoform X2 [Cyprinodon tularosa]